MDECGPPQSETSGLSLQDSRGRVSVTWTGDPCLRRYELSTTAARRASSPSPRVLEERPEDPILRTGHVLFDAAYTLALTEAREASVSRIRDGAFNGGQEVDCPAQGCFETGKEWPYVWSRDTGYALHLGLAFFDPPRAMSSLLFKVSDRRAGGTPELVQDTGTGGSWPISTDRVVLALGARAVLPELEPALRAEFVGRFFPALQNTVARDLVTIFDPQDGLYRGEQSFLDWREQSYPSWASEELVHIGLSKSLSTNLAHLYALRLLAELAQETGDTTLAAAVTPRADQLRRRIEARFWLPDEQLPSSFIPTTLDPAPVRRYDLLGLSLAVLGGVLSPERARAALSAYPVFEHGPPVLWPQQQFTPIYHNRAIWPFVTAYAAKAARRAGHAPFVTHALSSLFSGATLFLSNLENLELVSGLPYLEDGAYSGPVVNSERQLWSVGGYLGAVNQVLFGIEAETDALRIEPYLPKALRAELFAASETLQLSRFPFHRHRISVRLRLPPLGPNRSGTYRVRESRLNGVTHESSVFARSELAAENLVEIELEDTDEAPDPALRRPTNTSDHRQLFGPRTPVIDLVSQEAGGIRLDWQGAGEVAADLEFSVYRNGLRIAPALDGAVGTYLDPLNGQDGRVPCYAVESRYRVSGNVSQRSKPVCLFAPSDRVASLYATEFETVGGTLVNQHGRWHHEAWGDPGHELVIPDFQARYSGSHLIQLIGSNGAGPRDTGITAGAKRLRVLTHDGGALLAEGLVFLPQSGRWDQWQEGSLLQVELEAGTSYRLVLDDAPSFRNLSELQHFADYTGGLGGRTGPFFRLNVAEFRVLALEVP